MVRRYGWGLLLLGLVGCSAPPLLAPAPAPSAPPAASTAPPEAAEVGEVTNVGPLILRGTPPVPEALRERMSRYNEARSATSFGLSPDTKSMLIGTRFGQTTQLHWVRQPLGARTQLTFRDEPIGAASINPVDEAHLVYLADRGGDENYQVYSFNRRSGETVRLTDGTSRHLGVVWHPSGTRVAYASNARNGKDMDIYVGSSREPLEAKRVLEREGHFIPLEFSRDGGLLLIGHYVSINDSRLYLFDLQQERLIRVSPEEPAAHLPATLSIAGNQVYRATDRDGEFKQLELYDLRDQKTTKLTSDLPWSVEELALSPDGQSLAFVVNVDGYGELRVLDTRTRKHRALPGVPKGIVSDIRFSSRESVLGFTLSRATGPGDAYRYDLKSGRLDRFTESEVGGIPAGHFIEPSLVRYSSFDGREIPAFYYRPRGAGPFPVVVSIHGGPEAQARPSFSPLFQYLAAELGVAVLVPNVRGSDGYGKTYLLLDNGRKREDSVKDIGALLDWVKQQSELDEARVGVYGGSYGGYMVLASLVHFGERIRAGVDVVGISNFVTFLENTQAYRRDLRRAEYGDERDPAMRRFLLDISPARHASKIKSALFVAHGANDPRVPLSETDQIVEAVRAAGQDVWYLTAMNEGHGFRKKENRDMFMWLTALFFERHLMSGAEGSPTGAEGNPAGAGDEAAGARP
ncbi:MAG: S9 family peptidase [Polyangiaceae bacterium]|nr:S9 family peptidase [Polyangiaceae bacterium]MCW5789683.1 S9 family peptidase [Polyangiaceae bacterium]